MSTELIITFVALAVEVGLLAFVYFQARKPTVPGKVRVFPYSAVFLALVVMIFLTAAHAISLITGHRLEPRKPKGMR